MCAIRVRFRAVKGEKPNKTKKEKKPKSLISKLKLVESYKVVYSIIYIIYNIYYKVYMDTL